MTLTSWTDDELAANARGQLAPTQIAKLRAAARQTAIATVVTMVLMIAAFAVLWIVPGGTALYVLGGLLDATVVGFGTASLVIRKRALDDDLRAGTVTAVTGVVSIGTTHRGGKRGADWKVLKIGEREVLPMFPGLDALAGKTVTAYALPRSERVFAVTA